jgi:hypothetical protein
MSPIRIRSKVDVKSPVGPKWKPAEVSGRKVSVLLESELRVQRPPAEGGIGLNVRCKETSPDEQSHGKAPLRSSGFPDHRIGFAFHVEIAGTKGALPGIN